MTDEQLRMFLLLQSYYVATSTLAVELEAKKIDAARLAERVVELSKAYEAKLKAPEAK